MRNTTAAYASSASNDVTAYEDLPGHHLLAVRNLIATTNVSRLGQQAAPRDLTQVRGVRLLRCA
jgi:hypothetical protein